LIPSLDSRTRVLLLQHPSEVRHALNTAKLAALGLRNAQLQVGEVFEDLAELLEAPGYRSVLLFPGDEAQPLVAYGDDQDDRPWQLVVPDGTWRKASKLLHLNPLLGALPRVTLAQVQPSRYRLRKAPQPGALSTLEAVVQALNVLEAPQNFDALLKPFEALIEGQIAAMGRETYERNHLR
jgi:DTW domain-containing protein YfiP